MASGRSPRDPIACAEAVELMHSLAPVNTNSTSSHQFNRDVVRRDAAETRIVVHHRFPDLVKAFLDHKRRHGSDLEKSFYGAPETWTWQQQVARLIEMRPLVFMNGSDYTRLRDGRRVGTIAKEWDRVGTGSESTNIYVTLKEYLSYDEIMLGSLLGVSGPSYFINDGKRNNQARPGKIGTYERRGIIVGLVGARFERQDHMDSAFMCRPIDSPRMHSHLRDIFQTAFRKPREDSLHFDPTMYKARMRISVDILLLEANDRAKASGQKAYVHVVGLGLGVWQINRDQPQLYVEAFAEAMDDFGGRLLHIGTLDFSWIAVPTETRRLLGTATDKCDDIDVIFSKRDPAAKLPHDKEEQLLVVSYAWDGNSFPGNEYWDGSLSASGDPAAACMSTISELHNPILNPGYLGRIEVLQVPSE
ncbi:hypothetical protein BJ170DRAFT_695379 [Xylariales sp. AK1849]|nr:hypothetical protein BJ170DRAFT_695379 [Xylariales sp. AK1849]